MFSCNFIQNFYNFPLNCIIAACIVVAALSTIAAADGQYEPSNIVFPKAFLKRQRSFKILTRNAVTADSVIELSRAAEAFSLEYFERLSRVEANGNANVIVSPLSIWSILLLLAEGSTGQTYQQLANVLRLPADLTRIRMVYRYLLSALAENHTAVELTMNQVLFCDINRPIDVDFQEKLEHVYNADYYPVNFIDTVGTAAKINAYVKQQTQGRIDKIIQWNDLKMVHMLLVSAIFFQGRWKDPFRPEETRIQPFYDENDRKIADVPIMFRKGGSSHIYMPELQADILELSYGSDQKFSMVILLPRKQIQLIRVTDNLRVFGLHNVIARLNQAEEDDELEIHLPKFTIASDYRVTDILTQMGVTDLFSQKLADLSKITQHPIFVSQFIQKAVIDVNEVGTAATAANVVALSFQSIPSEFFVNRPFAFLIIERTTNSILFCGNVKNPAIV